jgi:hypothetical protein
VGPAGGEDAEGGAAGQQVDVAHGRCSFSGRGVTDRGCRGRSGGGESPQSLPYQSRRGPRRFAPRRPTRGEKHSPPEGGSGRTGRGVGPDTLYSWRGEQEGPALSGTAA